MESKNSVEEKLGYLTGIVETLPETIRADRAQLLGEIKEIKEIFKEHDKSDKEFFKHYDEWRNSVDKKFAAQTGYIAGASLIITLVVGIITY